MGMTAAKWFHGSQLNPWAQYEQEKGGGWNPYATALANPLNIGFQRGGHTGSWDWAGTAQDYEWSDVIKDSPLKYRYDYEQSGLDTDILSQLKNIFTGRAGSNERYRIGGEDVTDPMDLLQYTDITSKESLANMANLAGKRSSGGRIDPSQIEAFKPEEIAKASKQFYNPFERFGRANLLENLVKNIGERAPSGFAGSGERDKFLGFERGQFGGGMADILAEIFSKSTEGKKNLQLKIDSLRSLFE